MRTLIWKELREHVRWLPIGLIVIAAVCYLAAPSRFTDQLLAARLVTQLAIVAPLLAFALGIVQAYRDLQPAGSAYLNHRSVTTRQIFMAKVVAGCALYVTAIVVPLLLLAAWIAIQGMQWHPMRPAQVVPALVFALASFALHPAAMLVLARDASWWGTRILPLIPVAAALMPLFTYFRQGGLRGAAIGLIGAVLLIVWIVWIARQGWRQYATDPPASLSNHSLRRRWLLPTYLAVGSLSVMLAAVFAAAVTVDTLTRPSFYVPQTRNSLAVDSETGTLWMMTLVQEVDLESGGYNVETSGGEQIVAGKSVNPLQSKNLPETTRFFNWMNVPSSSRSSLQLFDTYFNSDGFFSNPVTLLDKTFRYSFDERGYLIRYSIFPQTRWQATIAADGVYRPGDWSGQPFTGNPLMSGWAPFTAIENAGFEPPLVDKNGLYLFDQSRSAIRKLIDSRIDALSLLASAEGKSPTLLIRSGDQLLEYALLDGSRSDEWLQQGDSEASQVRSQVRSLYDLPLTLQLINTIDLPTELSTMGNLRIARSPSGWYVGSNDSSTTVYHLSSQGQLDTISFQIQPGTSSPPPDDRWRTVTAAVAMFPGGVWISGALMATWALLTQRMSETISEIAGQYPITITQWSISFTLVTLFSLWLTRRVVQQRGLSHGQVRIWSWSVLLLGLAAPLSVVAIYRKVLREPCPRCQQPRRVDEDRCEHCGAQWEPPQSEGIEIIDAHRLPQQADGVPV